MFFKIKNEFATMKVEKFAGIDIGSNGVRLLIMNVYEKDSKRIYNKNILVRVPIRLGSDSFVHNEIKDDTLDNLNSAMISFKHLMKVHGVKKYRACATSALREALNSKDVIDYIKEHSGIEIELIDGKTEADIIYKTQINDLLEENKGFLFIDVGGGSTELTYFYNKKSIFSRSFKIGAVRSLKQLVAESEWNQLKEFIEKANINENTLAVGTGGNINTLFKQSQKPLGKPLSYSYILEQFKKLKSLTVDERILEYGFNPDRADVIVPALEIYLFVLKQAQIKQILVPKIGLADGLVKTIE